MNSSVIIIGPSELAKAIYFTVKPVTYLVKMVGDRFEDLMAALGEGILALRVLQGINSYEIFNRNILQYSVIRIHN